jgi:hypothetical protein
MTVAADFWSFGRAIINKLIAEVAALGGGDGATR